MAKAKEKILYTALALFNEHGSQTITTNHIAKECGISTGTLYYHFKNKEEIIRALYEQMGSEWEAPLSSIRILDSMAFERVKDISDAIYKKYRFISNELYVLCQNDPLMDKMNRERLIVRKIQIRELLEALIQTEGYEELEDDSMVFLTDTVWMFAVFWQPYRKMLYDEKETSPMKSLNIMLERFLIKKKQL